MRILTEVIERSGDIFRSIDRSITQCDRRRREHGSRVCRNLCVPVVILAAGLSPKLVQHGVDVSLVGRCICVVNAGRRVARLRAASIVGKARLAGIAAIEEEVGHVFPRTDHQHAHGLGEHHNRCEQQDPQRALALPVRPLLLFEFPPRKLQNVRHERHHDGYLHAVEESHQTPVYVARRHSEHRTNEDRPASAADEGRDGQCHRAQGDAHRLVVLVDSGLGVDERRRSLVVAIVSVQALLFIVVLGSQEVVLQVITGTVLSHALERCGAVAPVVARHGQESRRPYPPKLRRLDRQSDDLFQEASSQRPLAS